MTAATPKRMTKAQIITKLAEDTELSKKDIVAVFDALRNLIQRELTGRGAPGEFVLPDMLKLKVKRVPAQKNKKIRHPGTGEIT